MICSPVVAWLLLAAHFKAALGLILLAGVSDWFDGWAARRLGAAGHLGVVLDPAADKALLVTLFVVLGWMRLIPLWMFWLVIGRDLVIVTGALLVRTFRGVKTFLPSTLGKVSTFFQIVLVLLTVSNAAFPNEILFLLSFTALILSAAFTFLSGIGYVRTGIQMARWRHPSVVRTG